MFRGVAAAGLSIALCALTAAPALAGSTPPPSPSKKSASAAAKHSGSRSSASSGGSSGPVSFSSLPRPTGQCTGQGVDGQSAKRTPIPWAQQILDYSASWQFTQGAGVTVAVIDSGVDANSQFGHRVEVGQGLATAPSGAAASDCVGHGTMVAGIIGASAPPGGFAGVAPQATILSIKVTNSDTNFPIEAAAHGITEAVSLGAKVINVSLDTNHPDALLQEAVNYARSKNVVVVAAAGNDAQVQNPDGTTTTQKGPFYPASYPGVLSVGSVGQNGGLSVFADAKTRVDVTAPGDNITSTYPGKAGDAYFTGSGTSFAAPFVAGLAALVRARFPTMTAAGVVQRIEATADGSAGPGTGHGLVNPVQALTAVQPGHSASSAGQLGPVTVRRAVPDRNEKIVAVAVAGGAFGLAAVVVAAGIVIPAGRRRRWRPGQFS